MPTKVTTFLNESLKMSDEVPPEVLLNTQKILGKYVKKPPLTEKLLRRPPFRFLHDVINVVIKETGFLKGLYSDAELKSENVKEKNAKLTFLTKLVDAIKTITNTDLAVKPGKIIAGLEPTETNILLQAIGKALDNKLSSAKYIQDINNNANKKKQKSKTSPSEKNDVAKATKAKDAPTSNRISKSQERTKTKAKEAVSKTKEISPSTRTSKSEERKKVKETIVKSKSKIKDSIETKTQGKNKSSTPKSTSKETPKIERKLSQQTIASETISETKDEQEQGTFTPQSDDSPKTLFDHGISTAEDNKVTENSLLENKNAAPINEDADSENQENHLHKESITRERKSSGRERPKSARPKSGITRKEHVIPVDDVLDQSEFQIAPSKDLLRPPSVRPPSARPGAPRLRPESALPQEEVIPMGKINVIVENFANTEEEDEETVVIQTKPSEESVEIQPIVDLDISGEKGQLVEQILEQMSEQSAAQKPKIKTDIEWDGYKDNVHKEIEPLRTLVQTLTKTANPLGKLISYLHEDIESMHSELNMWKSIKHKTLEDIAKQERIKEESCKPLQLQLNDIQNSLTKQEEEILNIRSKILRNGSQIKQKISMQIEN